MLTTLTASLQRGLPLSDDGATEAVHLLAGDQAAAETKAAFLAALAAKGETVEEIAAFARALRLLSIRPPLDDSTRVREILDVCGTGGDRLNTFNISTTVSIVAAASGVTVAKHGNRAITSMAGSADVLEALGIRIDLDPEEAAARLREQHFAFFFAPRYHPAFRNIAPARRICAERGQRTIFNILGPLLNPARPTAQLVGVPRPALCESMARVLQSLGVRRCMVVAGAVAGRNQASPAGDRPPGSPPEITAYLDELSTLGDTTVAEFYQESGFAVSVLGPGNFPRQAATLADLAGGDAQTNAGIVRRIIDGDERGPKRDAVLLNVAAALFVSDRAKSMTQGWDLAVGLIDGGQARNKLKELAG